MMPDAEEAIVIEAADRKQALVNHPGEPDAAALFDPNGG